MHWLTILLIGIAANLDNLGIGVSYSLKSTRIPFISNILIALISMLAAYLAIAAGTMIAHYISLSFANYAGSLILLFLGIKCIVDCLKQEKELLPAEAYSNSNISKVIHEPDELDLNHDNVISWKESILLGSALAINCLAIGLGAGITGVTPLYTTFSIGLFSVLTIFFGDMIGSKLVGTRIGKYSNIVSGIMLILIAIYEMFF